MRSLDDPINPSRLGTLALLVLGLLMSLADHERQLIRKAGDSYRTVAKKLGLSLANPQRVLVEPTPIQHWDGRRGKTPLLLHPPGLWLVQDATGPGLVVVHEAVDHQAESPEGQKTTAKPRTDLLQQQQHGQRDDELKNALLLVGGHDGQSVMFKRQGQGLNRPTP